MSFSLFCHQLCSSENILFQLVQVANDGQKPVTFRNQAGQILQATPITVVSAGNQPTVPSFQTNGDTSICMQFSLSKVIYFRHLSITKEVQNGVKRICLFSNQYTANKYIPTATTTTTATANSCYFSRCAAGKNQAENCSCYVE